jgi:hypothetical protein
MSFTFRPASDIRDRHGLFVGVVGTTNSGKTFSAMRLARGIAGPDGKIAVVDTEGGRTLHLRDSFRFDVMTLDPPHRPARYADAAKAAEEAGYDALVIDSFTAEWAGLGGVLDWQAAELDRMAGDDYRKRDRVNMAAWIAPKTSHKQMVYSLLQRRIPIVFSIRGEETVKPGAGPGEKPQAVFRMIQNQQFPFELTVSFRLRAEAKGIIDLSDPTTFKMERAHRAIFRDGEQLGEEHGAALAAWATGQPMPERAPPPAQPRPRWAERMDEMMAELAGVQDGQALMALIDRARPTRDWLRENQPEASGKVEAAFADAYQKHVTPD